MSGSTISIVILVIMVILYASDKVPLAVVSIGACITMVLLGVMKPAAAWAHFSSDTEMLIAGMMIVGLALFETGVASMVGSWVVRFAGGRPSAAVFGLLVASMACSAFLNNTTTTVTFMPVLAGIIVSSRGALHEKTTLMPLANASCIGGCLTLVGSTPQVIIHGMLKEGGVASFGFFEYAKIGLPLCIVAILYQIFVAERLGRKIWGENPEHSEPMLQMIKSAEAGEAIDSKDTGSTKKILALVIFALTVAWMVLTDTKAMPMGTIAMIGGFLCIATNCISFKTVMKKLDWSTLVFFATALAFAGGFSDSGAGKVIADTVIKMCGQSVNPLLIFAVTTTLTCLLTQVMSNTAVAALMAPIGLSMAATVGMNPLPMAMGIIMGSSVSLATPVATSPMTLIVGTGGYKFMDYVKFNGPLNLILLVVTMILIPVLWPL